MERTVEGLISTVWTPFEHVNLKIPAWSEALRSQISTFDLRI